MYRIDGADAAATIPTPAAVGPQPDGFFRDKNPSVGLNGTIVSADWLNAVQEELCYVITQNSIGLNKTNRTQLYQAINNMIANGAQGVPVGSVVAMSRASAPSGYILCDGSAVSRTTYSALFSAIGTAEGNGDGSTTFNIPDMRGRVPIGVDGIANRVTSASTGGANADSIGGVGGAQTHTLTVTEIPAHTHSYDRFTGSGVGFLANGSGDGNDPWTTGSTGGDGAHNNMPPWSAKNWFIKV